MTILGFLSLKVTITFEIYRFLEASLSQANPTVLALIASLIRLMEWNYTSRLTMYMADQVSIPICAKFLDGLCLPLPRHHHCLYLLPTVLRDLCWHQLLPRDLCIWRRSYPVFRL